MRPTSKTMRTFLRDVLLVVGILNVGYLSGIYRANHHPSLLLPISLH